MKERDHRLGDYFKLYARLVKCNVYLITHDHYLAEDICQDTFERLSENLEHVPSEKVKRWLMVTSTNLTYDYLKKGGQYKTILAEELSEELMCDIQSDPGNLLIEKEQKEKQLLVLERLRAEKPEWYEALMLYYMERKKDHEIGAALNMKASLVGKWRERTKAWLSKAYKEKEEGDS